jgi:hypothetical protein
VWPWSLALPALEKKIRLAAFLFRENYAGRHASLFLFFSFFFSCSHLLSCKEITLADKRSLMLTWDSSM